MVIGSIFYDVQKRCSYTRSFIRDKASVLVTGVEETNWYLICQEDKILIMTFVHFIGLPDGELCFLFFTEKVTSHSWRFFVGVSLREYEIDAVWQRFSLRLCW